jgi:hypothetical protein
MPQALNKKIPALFTSPMDDLFIDNLDFSDQSGKLTLRYLFNLD